MCMRKLWLTAALALAPGMSAAEEPPCDAIEETAAE